LIGEISEDSEVDEYLEDGRQIAESFGQLLCTKIFTNCLMEPKFN
jgi:hypothetical protein